MSVNGLLSGQEVLNRVYTRFKENPDAKEIVLSRALGLKAFVSLTNGYICYETALLVEIDGKKIALAKGAVYQGSGTVDPCNSNLMAVSLPSEAGGNVAKAIRDKLMTSNGLEDSLICSFASNCLTVNNRNKLRKTEAVQLAGEKNGYQCRWPTSLPQVIAEALPRILAD